MTKEIFEGAQWRVIDANNMVLGRIATRTASLLLGKHRRDWAKNTVSPTYVIIINSDKVALTGNKETDKKYYRHSGYMGSLKMRTVAMQRKRDSKKIIFDAIAGMLPKNNLRDKRLRHLKIYAGAEHPHQAQLNN